MTTTAPIVAVGGIALDPHGRVLLICRGRPPHQGRWTIPGGRVELGETLAQACIREMREETGLEVEVGPVVEVVDKIERTDAGVVERHYVIVDFLVAVRGGELRPDDDAADARWFTADELSAVEVTEGLEPVLRRARACANSTR